MRPVGDFGAHRIAVHLLLGGEEKSDWALWPERDGILIRPACNWTLGDIYIAASLGYEPVAAKQKANKGLLADLEFLWGRI